MNSNEVVRELMVADHAMNEIILPDDERAAKRATVEGWVSRNGRFYGDGERLARWDGSTHARCSLCGSPVEKSWTACVACREKEDERRYLARSAVEWDGKAMLYSETRNRYYSCLEDALEDAEEGGYEVNDLRLRVCVPCRVPQLTVDFCEHVLPDVDDPIPDDLERAIYAFNEAVKDIVLSWEPGPNRLAR